MVYTCSPCHADDWYLIPSKHRSKVKAKFGFGKDHDADGMVNLPQGTFQSSSPLSPRMELTTSGLSITSPGHDDKVSDSLVDHRSGRAPHFGL